MKCILTRMIAFALHLHIHTLFISARSACVLVLYAMLYKIYNVNSGSAELYTELHCDCYVHTAVI
jgi:hypothetical protein